MPSLQNHLNFMTIVKFKLNPNQKLREVMKYQAVNSVKYVYWAVKEEQTEHKG